MTTQKPNNKPSTPSNQPSSPKPANQNPKPVNKPNSIPLRRDN